MAGDWTKSKLKDIKKARSGPSDKNCVEVNNKSVEEVNVPHSPSYVVENDRRKIECFV